MTPIPDRRHAPCPVEEVVGVLGGKWAVAVVGRLATGEARFGRLQSQIADGDGASVSSKVLAAELRRLVEGGVVARRERGAAVSYRLTPQGHDLVPLLDALAEWARREARSA